MHQAKTALITAAALSQAALLGTAHADVIASTDFDGRTLTGSSNHIATNLNWTTNGVADPGDLVAIRTTSNDVNQALFDNTAVAQNMFAPAWNYGNNGGFWSTEVDITVLPGFDVTLTDVTFDYWALSGAALPQGVTRRADFIVTLFDPTGSVVAGGSIGSIDVVGGNNTAAPVVSTFGAPVALTDPGTYTIQITAGEIAGVNETGNHAAIDNLVINGTVVPEPGSLALLGLGGMMIARRRRG